MNVQLKPIARASLSDAIVEQISGLIAGGSWAPGARIPSEGQLCKEFGVGRTSVREALRSLAAMGVVETRAGDGTFVAASGERCVERTMKFGVLLDARMVEDLIETRMMLESETAGLAAKKARREDVAEMRAALEGMKASVGDRERYLEEDLRFHEAVARGTRNAILGRLLAMTRGYLQTWIRETLAATEEADSRRRAEASVREHRRILAAIEGKDGVGARAAMAAHLRSSSRDLRKRILARAR